MPASPDDGARYAAPVRDLVAEAEGVLLELLAAAMRSGIDRDDWATVQLNQIRLWRARAERGVQGAQAQLADVVAQALIAAHTEGYVLAAADLGPGQVGPPAPAGQVLGKADAVTARVMATLQQAPRMLEQVYRQAVGAGAGEVTGGKVTRVAAAQHVLDRLGAQGVTGFRDSAGRNWSLTSYVEMAVRTEAGTVAVDGHVSALRAAGLDLVVVSDSPRECPLCRPWEGKVLSLTGTVGSMIVPSATGGPGVRMTVAATLEQARAAGLQHPNCRHTVSAFIPGATSLVKPKAEPAGYDAVQRQRGMERKVREWKRREALALDEAAAATARAKTREWQAALRQHVDANDLKRLRRREVGPGLAT